jgi:uncharacterized metal-binding protein YceD (DUF177 family)
VTQLEYELSRPVRVDQVPNSGMEFDIEAKPSERAALAERFGLVSIDALKARVRLRAMAGGTLIRVSGTLTASLVQTCVVTLDPLPAEIEEEFSMTFADGEADAAGGEIELSLDDEDPPDPIENGAIDVGEVVAEHLALALDPFPRKPGIEFQGGEDSAPLEEKKPSPFAALAQLRKNKG